MMSVKLNCPGQWSAGSLTNQPPLVAICQIFKKHLTVLQIFVNYLLSFLGKKKKKRRNKKEKFYLIDANSKKQLSK